MLVLGGIVSLQFGGALAATLVPRIGPGGTVLMRLLFAMVILYAVVRPAWTGYDRRAWLTVIAFGTVLGLMNFTFYASLAYLPLGVAVTVEFVGPLVLAAVLSRRLVDGLAVAVAGIGVVLISEAFQIPAGELELTGLGLALLTGVFWAAYIILSARTGAAFARLDGLALAMVLASLITLPLGVGSVPQWDAGIVATGLGIAVLSSVLPYSLELLALRRLSARVFGVLLSLEPAVAAVAGLVIAGQRLEPAQLLGMALVVLASAAVLGLVRRQQPAAAAQR